MLAGVFVANVCLVVAGHRERVTPENTGNCHSRGIWALSSFLPQNILSHRV